VTLGLLFPLNAVSAPVRRTWFIEQISRSYEPTAPDASRHQLGLGTVSYGEAFSFSAMALADFGAFEIAATGTQRSFGTSTPDALDLKNTLLSEVQSVGGEIARYRVNPKGLYGRLGLGVMTFLPSALSYWKIAISTGVLSSASLPWEFRLSLNIWLSFNRVNDYLLLGAETFRTFQLGGRNALDVGGFFTYSQLSKAQTAGERLLLALGPTIAHRSRLGRFSVSVPMRVWLDSGASGAFISDFSTPALNAHWQLVF
jgi:hypothetical protein